MTSYVNIPILICAFSRESEFCRVLYSAISAGVSQIYINIDGADNPRISKSQEAMVAFTNHCRSEFPHVQIFVRRSNMNFGAAVSVISSLDWFFSKEVFGLIFEDDLEFDGSLLDFVSWAAPNFEHNPDIWMISGSNFFSFSKELKGKIHLPSYPVTWGWATWRDKWNLIREAIVSDIESPSLFSLNVVSNFWQVGALRAKKGILDAWDIPLAEAMRRLRKFSVVPPVNLVRNIGFSELASNTKLQNYPLDLPIERVPNLNQLDKFLRNNLMYGREIDSLYETYIYEITSRNYLTVWLSQLDFLRLEKYSNESLKHRLENVRDSQYRMI